jgi:hypothetical protein
MNLVHEPGSIRHVHYLSGRDADGKYPITYWGDVDEQIAEATLENAKATTRLSHVPMPLYAYAENCEHSNPEDADRYRDVDDLVDEWMRRNTPCLTWRDGALYYKNRARGEASVPLFVEWRAAQDAYDDVHQSGVCLDSPQGTCCTACTEGDDDYGYEAGACALPQQVRNAYDDFWWRVSPDAIADRARQEAET